MTSRSLLRDDIYCCYVAKPLDLDQFGKVVRWVEDFSFLIVKLPYGAGS